MKSILERSVKNNWSFILDLRLTSYFGVMNEELAKSDVCRNCGSPEMRIYCSACGQKTIFYRFNLKDSMRWLFAKVFDMEQGFFYTTLQILKKPEKVIGDYLNGATRPYSHPFRFVFIWSTLSIVVGYWLGTFEIVAEQMGHPVQQDIQQNEMQAEINAFIQKYMNLIIVGMIPFLALWCKLFYRKHNLNLTEHIIINCFGMGAASALGIVVNFLYYIPGLVAYMMAASVLLMALITGRVYSRYLKENLIVSSLKYLVIYMLGTLLSMVIGSIVAVVAMLIFK